MKKPVFTGSGVAIITPFIKGGGINFPELERLIEFQIANGTDAIIICGTTGETATMTEAEHKAAIEFAVKTVNGRIPVIAGTGSNNTAHALEMSQFACSVGVDALLIVTPYYNKATQAGLIKHFEYIADRVTRPIILYNVPGRTGVSFTAATYKKLSAHPMINGIKEASGNFTLIAQTLALCGDDLNMWSGNDDQTTAMMALGAKGVISVFANIMPRESHMLAQACLDGDFAEGARLQLKYFDLMNRLFIEVNPIPVKTAAGLMGFDVGELRLPMCDMSAENLEILKTSMKNAGLRIK